MARGTKGQFGSLFAREVPGVDMLLPDEQPPAFAESPPATIARPARPLAKSRNPEWMKSGILIRKTTNVKLRQYLLGQAGAQGQGSSDVSDLVDRILSEWADRQVSS